ncbi:hypothetical protein RCO27_01530 [Sphingosinicella sp. LHD-64]|uniref:hypothetical protein n=1 Tax=Sphingosinicella sp. LHD-64 TaxID=3072139 RepID=UPI00280D4469|nr:hypothetical protein [Sphingosinicella sp. LHD-64]MDQ8754897.1 hypothetical protein [Sphingosinicella sp. LHD-64]
MLKIAQSAAIGLVMWLIPAAITGMLVILFFGFFGEDDLLSFAVWLVIGIFTGLFVFNTGAAWLTDAKDPGDFVITPALGLRLIVVQMLMLAGLSLCFYWLLWSEGTLEDVIVPGHMWQTLFFFAAVGGGMWLGRLMSVWEFEEAEGRRNAVSRDTPRKS